MDLTSNRPKVSVCVVTYNQEKYISECLESLVNQKTDFRFEILVADDFSNDGTRAIVTDFCNRYPGIITKFFHAENIGAFRNFVYVHEQAKGEFIAHMDGDDYALPGKLQAQVVFLERHPECNIVWHRMLLQNDRNGVIVPDLVDLTQIENIFRRSDIVRYITIGMNSSKMYRAAARSFPMPGFPVVDYFANVEQVRDGFAAFACAEPLGVYRTGIGIASAGNTTTLLLRDSFVYFLRRFPDCRKDVCVAALMLAAAAAKNGRWSNCAMFAHVALQSHDFRALGILLRFRHVFPMFRFPKLIRNSRR